MPVTYYKIWSTGPAVGDGATQSVHVGVAGIAKGNTPGPPTTVANELVCNRLASALLLPIPPGFLIEHSGKPHFVSLNFNLAGQQLPPVVPTEVVTAHPELSWGIVLFDMWVVNWDRHSRNLAYDKPSNRVQIFDHSHTLLSRGLPVLVANKGAPGIERHCIAPVITSLTGASAWHQRILSLPEHYLRAVVTELGESQFNVSQSDAAALADFLLERRPLLLDIARSHQSIFPNINAADWQQL